MLDRLERRLGVQSLFLGEQVIRKFEIVSSGGLALST
jgi:hypothetical protein